jgi:hypothetical protein
MKTVNRIYLIFLVCLFLYSGKTINAQTYSFIPSFKKNEKLVYQEIETKFRQNNNGYYTFLMYDTTYMIFNVVDVNDSMTIIEYNHADYFKDGKPSIDESNQKDLFKTETYRIALNNKGEFIELINWEFFAALLIDNLKIDFLEKKIDSNTLKMYYVQYHNQAVVEEVVIPSIIELFKYHGQTVTESISQNMAKEILNPFGGDPIEKSCSFKLYKNNNFKNSVFLKGTVFTNADENEKLQEDYFNFLKQKPNITEEYITPPDIYIIDTYELQWGLINKRTMYYTSSHTIFINNDKQGLDRIIRFYTVY